MGGGYEYSEYGTLFEYLHASGQLGKIVEESYKMVRAPPGGSARNLDY